MNATVVWLALPGVLAIFIVNMMSLAPFQALCKRVAQIEGRQKELEAAAIEGGSNFFEIEQYGRLWRRTYRRFGDPEVTRIGDRAFKWAAIAGVINLLFAAAIVGELVD